MPGAALPYVDEHAIRIAAPRDRVWAALRRHVARSLLEPESRDLFRTILGTEPAAGFAVAGEEPGRNLTLAGKHRFSRYTLAFDLADDEDETTELRATTHAAFPGVHGGVYRALVIGTRLHVVATKLILRAVQRRAVRPDGASPG